MTSYTLTARQAANYLEQKRPAGNWYRFLRRNRAGEKGPLIPFIRVGRHSYYAQADLDLHILRSTCARPKLMTFAEAAVGSISRLVVRLRQRPA